MAVVIPTDQVPIITGIDPNFENRWNMNATGSGTTLDPWIINTTTQARGSYFIYVRFRVYKNADDIIDTRVATWGTGGWSIPPQYVSGAGWSAISSGHYTATPASTSRLTMSDTTNMVQYRQIKFKIGGYQRTAAISAVSTNAYIDVVGTALDGDVSDLAVFIPSAGGIPTGFEYKSARVDIVRKDTVPMICELTETWWYQDPYFQ